MAAQLVKNKGGSVAFKPSEAMVMNVLRPDQKRAEATGVKVEMEKTEDSLEEAEDSDLNQCVLEDILYST